jgi:hypothetical protein
MGGALGGSTPGANRSDFVHQVGSRWVVTSEDGSKSLGSYPSKARAARRLRQVEWFKNHSDGLATFGLDPQDLINRESPRTISYAGLPILVENEVGSQRYWVDTDGTYNSTLMKVPYGCIEGAVGADDEDVDVYLGPDEGASHAFVIHQNKAPEFTDYDEDKVMLGFSSAAEAAAAYLGQYDDPRFFGGMDVISMDELREIAGDGGAVGKIVGDPVVPPELVQDILEQPMPKSSYSAQRVGIDDDTSSGKAGLVESDAELAGAAARPEITSASTIEDSQDDDTRRPPGKQVNLEGFEVENSGPTGYPSGHYAVGGDGTFASDDPSKQGAGLPGMP